MKRWVYEKIREEGSIRFFLFLMENVLYFVKVNKEMNLYV